MKHELKTWPEPFRAMANGTKQFEFRQNDRGFQVGDCLVLREWSPIQQEYVGGQMERLVSYISHAPDWGIGPKFCVMSLVDSPDKLYPKMTWLPGLLICVLKQCINLKPFKDKQALLRVVERTIYENT